jgi:hypothetical protein
MLLGGIFGDDARNGASGTAFFSQYVEFSGKLRNKCAVIEALRTI